MEDNFEVLYHNCIRFSGKKVIYTDPFKLNQNYNDADIIFITHSHYDHFSPEDIEKVKCEKTNIVVPKDLSEKCIEIGFDKDKILVVEPNQNYKIFEINFSTVSAYNTNKVFHPKEKNWVGYILEIEGAKCYISGDIDIIEEAKNVKCDVAFVPIGGTYTMTASESAELINYIKPKIAVPVHYATIVGEKKDAEIFKNLLEKSIKCKIMA